MKSAVVGRGKVADLGRHLLARRSLVAPNQGLLNALVDFHAGFGPVLVQVAVHLILGTLQILDGFLALLSLGLVLSLGLLHPGGGLALDGHGLAGDWRLDLLGWRWGGALLSRRGHGRWGQNQAHGHDQGQYPSLHGFTSCGKNFPTIQPRHSLGNSLGALRRLVI
jgi:hypothetical protein